MIIENKYKEVRWIDLENPTRGEVDQLMEEYNIHPLVGEELLQPTIRSRVDVYKNFIYLILHFPDKFYGKNGEGERVREIEIDFVIGRDFLITAHYKHSDILFNFGKRLETSVLLEKAKLGEHSGLLFFYIVREIYKNMQEELDLFSVKLKEMEHNVFARNDQDFVAELSRIRRMFMDYKQTIRFHGDILRSFSEEGKNFFGVDFSHYLSYITSEYWKVYNALEGHRETLNELHDTHQTILTTRSNKIMQTITILAFIAVPGTMVAQIMSSGIFNWDGINQEIGGWILGAVILASFFLALYFKKKRWI